jgi:tRNA threonylcarbamoyladenosine biosynthesis protein TsaB
VRLLAIDTTEAACSAALLVDGEVYERFEVAPRRHSALVLPMKDELLREGGLALNDLDALAFARGPGSFTGVRIAASIIQGAAFGAGRRVLPVSSLQALAQGAARTSGAQAILVALDARMQEVYWGAYRGFAGRPVEAIGEERVCAPNAVPIPEPGDWHGAGSGWLAHGEALMARCGNPAKVYADQQIHAKDVAVLAAHHFAAGQSVSAEDALPVYLRNQVARTKS